MLNAASGRARSHRSSRSSSLGSFDPSADHSHGYSVLASRLLQRVTEIGFRVQERSPPTTPALPFDSAGASFSEMSGEAKVASLPVLPMLRHVVSPREPSFHCTSTADMRAIVVADDKSIIFNCGGDLAQHGAPPKLTAAMVLLTYTVAATGDAGGTACPPF
ncbi:hypothetical_protein [Leishmania braziliensis MHOM/BR/75/M2904]|uniref:Hypothetical_protein n=1 Tax=Leishmania braziliensis MHOM/BR/75/M2904 TaxID=420245 RepID=A0A3P3ZHI1_LEIBR|nr:unnamed protein product [Leishmania braziliensis]SYZ69718.1 hypothetical_protein [Leishmania braziliensis MHOM/BR/75/M2904]